MSEMIDVFNFWDLVGNEEKLLQLGQVLQTLDDFQTIERNVQNFQVNQAIQIFNLSDLNEKSEIWLGINGLHVRSVDNTLHTLGMKK